MDGKKLDSRGWLRKNKRADEMGLIADHERAMLPNRALDLFLMAVFLQTGKSTDRLGAKRHPVIQVGQTRPGKGETDGLWKDDACEFPLERIKRVVFPKDAGRLFIHAFESGSKRLLALVAGLQSDFQNRFLGVDKLLGGLGQPSS